MALTKITGEGVGAVDDVTIEGHASVGVNAVDATRALTVAGSTDDSSASGLVVYNSSLASKFSVRNDGYITAAGDIQVGGSLYVGGTAAANALDDYERGSYTITETNGDCTITSHRGTYVKVGDLVYVSGSFTVGSNSNGNVLNLSLPFTSTVGLNGIGGGNISFTNFNSTYVDANLRPCVENLASNFFFRWSQNNQVTCANVSGNRADFMVIYEAA